MSNMTIGVEALHGKKVDSSFPPPSKKKKKKKGH